MVDAQKLLDSYPHSQQAVSFTELIICIPPDGEDQSSWDLMMTTKTPMSPQEVVDIVREVIQDEVREGTKGRWEEAYSQTFHPSFMTYIRGKMGMV